MIGRRFQRIDKYEKAQILFEDYYRPSITLDKNYYILSNVDTIRW